MHDEELGDEVSRMLRERAARHPGQTDPVGLTKRHVAAAGSRRRKVYTGVAALAVTGGVVLGGQAFAGGSGSGSSTGAVFSPAAGATSTASAPTKATPTPTKTHILTPSVDCSQLKTRFPTAAEFDWGTRGSLASDADLGQALVQRAVALTKGAHAKLAYLGEDATTRVGVVLVDVEHTPGCGHIAAVVFHGAAGASADALGVQVGQGNYGPDFGFVWSERNHDGSMTLLDVLPPSVRTLMLRGAVDGSKVPESDVPTPDGTFMRTFAAGARVPLWLDFGGPYSSRKGDQSGNPISFVVVADSRQSVADALGLDASAVTKPEQQGSFPNYEAKGSGFTLFPPLKLDGAEQVYWGTYGYIPKTS